MHEQVLSPQHSEMSVAALSHDRYDQSFDQAIDQSIDHTLNQSMNCSSEEWINRSLHIGALPTIHSSNSLNSTGSFSSINQTINRTNNQSINRLISPSVSQASSPNPLINQSNSQLSYPASSQSNQSIHPPIHLPNNQSNNQSSYAVFSPVVDDLDTVDNELYDIFRLASRFDPNAQSNNQTSEQSNNQSNEQSNTLSSNLSGNQFISPDRTFDVFPSPVPQFGRSFSQTDNQSINQSINHVVPSSIPLNNQPVPHPVHQPTYQPTYQPVHQIINQPINQPNTFASYPTYPITTHQSQMIDQSNNSLMYQIPMYQPPPHHMMQHANQPGLKSSIYYPPVYSAHPSVPGRIVTEPIGQSISQPSILESPAHRQTIEQSHSMHQPTKKAHSVLISPQRTSPKPLHQPPPLEQSINQSVTPSINQSANQYYGWHGRSVVVDEEIESDSESVTIKHSINPPVGSRPRAGSAVSPADQLVNQSVNQNRPRKRTNADSNESVSQSMNQSTFTKQKIEYEIDDDQSVSQSINGSSKLARKAELARASRKRKKAYVKSLEDQLAQSQARCAELEAACAKNAAKVSREERMRKEQQASIKERLVQLITKANQANKQPVDQSNDHSSMQLDQSTSQSSVQLPADSSNNQPSDQSNNQTTDQSIAQPTIPSPSQSTNQSMPPVHPATNLTSAESAELSTLVTRFVYNSRERQSLVDHYFDIVHNCLTPGLQVKFAMWGLDQNDQFYTGGLWSQLLANEVGLTEAQINWIKGKRSCMHQERKNLATCEAMLRETRGAIHMHLRSLHGHMDDLLSVMTPLQCAKFYLWVEANSWSMEMLNGFFDTQPKQ